MFLISNSGNINQNCTYIQNPGFPTVYTATGQLSYTISKSSIGGLKVLDLIQNAATFYLNKISDICYLRLDFETFNILGPTVLGEADGGACLVDVLKATVGPTLLPLLEIDPLT